jgi:rod shape determining protein RodA
MSLLGIWYFIGSMLFFIITNILFKKNILQTSAFIAFIFVISYFSPNIMKFMPQNTQDRIEIFINPNSDPLNKGYNVMQSVLAVGSGGVTGKGYLKGSQTQLRYIPEQRTDFIFCVPTEEFGFIGGALVIILYSLLVWRILKIATNTSSTFFSITSFGICTIFLYHAVINIGMVIRIMPVMGIPLPFMSYGGSALLVNMAMIGLLMNAHRTKKKTN